VWISYSLLQGTILTGLWVIGHECGHRAFSASSAVNDFVGLIVHSLLLVPFHSWRITHGNHHKNNIHLENDSVFLPKKKRDYLLPQSIAHKIWANKIVTLVRLLIMLTIGFPIYLFTNVTGQKFESGWANHFNPNAPLFTKNQRAQIIISDIGILCALSLLGYLSYTFGFITIFKLYGGSYMVNNTWLSLITFIQHTDQTVPHLADSEWTWLKGALATVDRDFGSAINVLLHHIHDTHICHHIFPQLPHYHAVEATKCIKQVLGKYYAFDDTFFLKALWNNWNYCEYINDEDTIAYFKHYE